MVPEVVPGQISH